MIIEFPIHRLTFEPADIDMTKVLATYDKRKVYVATCVRLLQRSPQQLRETVASVASSEDDLEGLIEETESCAEDFRALVHFFDCLGARLTALQRRLI